MQQLTDLEVLDLIYIMDLREIPVSIYAVGYFMEQLGCFNTAGWSVGNLLELGLLEEDEYFKPSELGKAAATKDITPLVWRMINIVRGW